MLVDATYTAFLVPIGIAFHFKAQTFSWYNAVDIAAGKPRRMSCYPCSAACTCMSLLGSRGALFIRVNFNPTW